MKQRDEIIGQLKSEKRMINSEMQSKTKELMAVKEKHQQLEEVMRKGESLMTNQVKELNQDQEKLLAKLQYEIVQRKRLHNVIEDMKGKIRVFLRVRPLSQKEIDLQSKTIVKIMDEFTLKFKMKQDEK